MTPGGTEEPMIGGGGGGVGAAITGGGAGFGVKLRVGGLGRGEPIGGIVFCRTRCIAGSDDERGKPAACGSGGNVARRPGRPLLGGVSGRPCPIGFDGGPVRATVTLSSSNWLVLAGGRVAVAGLAAAAG